MSGALIRQGSAWAIGAIKSWRPIMRENGGFRRQWCVPKWRATVDEDGHYSFAMAL